ncbi:Fic family protein [Egicoccus sp. AB-alg6-2]|uniref:Fic family protein n=1 Tax=Egicoccus sp. AB-alg6-2 TaxID=3242692 RepID=UPI00359CE317
MALSGVIAGHTVGPYLDTLQAEADDLASALTDATDADADGASAAGASAAAEARRREAMLASLRLDGSPIEAWPDDDLMTVATLATDLADAEFADADGGADLDSAAPGTATAPAPADAGAGADPAVRGSWFDAMRLFDVPDEVLLARELLGVRSAMAADDLAAELVTDPAAALAHLHRRLTYGLVAPERAARLRTSEQAVHDASVGRILYFTVEPAQLAEGFAALVDWLRGPAGELPPLLAAGILHLELLRLHPFDAANGRLARVASRLWLRRNGLDPSGLAAAEVALAADALGYHEEVARTLRRRDATIWLERWAEAVVDGLAGSARALGIAGASLDRAGGRPGIGADPLDGLGAEFTLAEARDRLGADDLVSTRTAVERLCQAGVVTRVPGSRGLRFLRAIDCDLGSVD